MATRKPSLILKAYAYLLRLIAGGSDFAVAHERVVLFYDLDDKQSKKVVKMYDANN